MAACAAPWPTSRSTHSTQKHLRTWEVKTKADLSGQKGGKHLAASLCQSSPEAEEGKGAKGSNRSKLRALRNAGYISRLFVAPRELQCHPKPIKNPSASHTDAAAADSSHLFTGAALSLKGRAAGCTTHLDSCSILQRTYSHEFDLFI